MVDSLDNDGLHENAALSHSSSEINAPDPLSSEEMKMECRDRCQEKNRAMQKYESLRNSKAICPLAEQVKVFIKNFALFATWRRELIEATAADVPKEDVERIVEYFLQLCVESLLCPKEVVEEFAAKVLLVLVLACRGGHFRAITSPDKSHCVSKATLSRAETKDLCLLQTWSRIHGQNLVNIASFPKLFDDFQLDLRRFRDALGKQRFDFLLNDVKKASDRFSVFLDKLSWPDSDVQAYSATFFRRLGVTTVDDLMKHFEIVYLRTLRDDDIEQVAKNYSRWASLVSRFTTAKKVHPLTSDQELEGFLAGVEVVLRKAWSPQEKVIGIDDAIQDALVKVLKKAHTYHYEGSFERWLITTALNYLRNTYQQNLRDMKIRNDPDLPQVNKSVPRVEECLEIRERLIVLRQRYLIVETTFRQNSQLKARSAWRSLLTDFLDGYSDLGAMVDCLLDLDGPKRKDAGVRRRLRQRLSALGYIFDAVPMGAADLPSDKSVLEAIKTEYGLDSKDEPTIRMLANLARASRNDSTLAGPYAISLFVRLKLPYDQVKKRLMAFLSPEVKEGLLTLNSRREIIQRIQDCISIWATEPVRQKALSSLRGSVKDSKRTFLLVPCSLLTLIRHRYLQKQVSECGGSSGNLKDVACVVASILNQADSEIPIITEIVRKLMDFTERSD